MIISAKKLLYIFIVFLFLLLVNNPVYSGTNVSLTVSDLVSGVLSAEDLGLTDMAVQVQELSDKNGPFIANAFALSNMLGYPVGKSYLGSFPHFQLGLSVGSGCTNMEYFDDTDPSEEGTLPGFAPNPVIHFGMGLFGKFDVIGKMFYISKSALNKYYGEQNFETEFMSLNDFLVYSVGAKLRYNLVKKKRFLPFYLAFGGVSLSIGGNFMYGKINFLGEYEYQFSDIPADLGTPTPVVLNMDFLGEFESEINWKIFTMDVQAIAYFDILYLFSLYSGFGLAGNIGSFGFQFSGIGTMTTDNAIYQTVTSSDQVGQLVFISNNKYKSSPVMPAYILGLEINILVVKLNVETMVNMLNRSDVNFQAGFRVQI